MRIASPTPCRARSTRRRGTTWPTSDQLREALFNVLGQSLDSARVLDVCTGTGAKVAINAEPRRAHATCLDHDACIVRGNAARLGVEAAV